jgi:hypothetical protein
MKEFYIHISSRISEEEIAFNRKHGMSIIRPGNALITAQAIESYLDLPNINQNIADLLKDILAETNKTMSRTAVVSSDFIDLLR